MKQQFRTLIKYLIPAILIIIIAGAAFLFRDRLLPDKGSDIIARVGSREITKEQFVREMERSRGFRSGNLDKQALLEKMIDNEVLLNKALEVGLDKDPDIIRSYHNLLIGRMKRKELNPLIENAEITEDEMKAWYEENKETYTRPARVRLALIYIKTNPTMSQEKLAEIRERLAQAREKALKLSGERGFGKLAAEYSEDQTTRYKGGDIGWVSKGRKYRWDQAVLDAGFSLENIGDISSIITGEKGLYLIKLLDLRKSSVTPIEKVKTRIRHKLLLEKRRQIETDFLRSRRNDTQIEIYPESLEAVPRPADGPGKRKNDPPKLPSR